MGLTAASVTALTNTDAAEVMAPALTEPVTSSDISGQSPRPGDSITSHHHHHPHHHHHHHHHHLHHHLEDDDDIGLLASTTTDTATENHEPNNILSNGTGGGGTGTGTATVNHSNKNSTTTAGNHNKKSVKNNKAQQQIALIEENLLATTTDEQQRRRRSAHMDQKGTTTLSSNTEACTDNKNDATTATTTAAVVDNSGGVLVPPQHGGGDTTTSTGIVTPLGDSADTNSIAGLPKDFGKDVAEVEQMLGDLASSGDIDLLSVFKTFESAPVNDAGFNLADSLFNEVTEADAAVLNQYESVDASPSSKECEVLEMRAEIEKCQAQMQRKADFLLRRLRKMQSRYMVRHAAEEIVGIVEQTQRTVRRKEREREDETKVMQDDLLPPALASGVLPYQPPPRTPPDQQDTKMARPISGPAMRSFLKRLEVTAGHQRATTSKRHMSARYFSPASQELLLSMPSTSKSVAQSLIAVPRFEDRLIEQIDQMSGLLHAEMRIVEKGMDSDATASSSGGESADEMVPYTNQTQEHLYIEKRAAWRWACDRSKIASKWTWLLAQISDLEYRIRQHNELYQQIKKTKGNVELEGTEPQLLPPPPPPHLEQQSVNGYCGILPGSMGKSDAAADAAGSQQDDTANGSCSRTRPYRKATFRKRKLLQTSNLHTISKKAARASTVKCGCHSPLQPCGLCTGRPDPTAPRDLSTIMPAPDRIALLDSCYHPVLSFKEDASHGVHFEAVMQSTEWQTRAMRYTSKAAMRAAERMSQAGSGGGDASSNARTKKQQQRDADDRRPKKYRKNKASKNSNNRVKLSQLFGKNNKHNNSKASTNNNARIKKNNKGPAHKAHHPADYNRSAGGGLSLPGGGNKNSSAYANSYLQHLDMESGGSGNTSGRSKNASPVMGQPKSERVPAEHRRSRTAYDIDNIIIPYSVAAQTRVEVLPYKEIPTPKWRIVEDDEAPNTSQVLSLEDEDITDEAVVTMHEKALAEERKKFASYLKYPNTSRSRANRRIDSHASSGTNTPINPTSPGVQTPNDVEPVPSPAYPSTPATPLEITTSEASELNVVNALNQTVNALTGKRERRRTSSMKALHQQSSTVDTRSNTPELREMIPPFERRIFPLPDTLYDEMLNEMPKGIHDDDDMAMVDTTTDDFDGETSSTTPATAAAAAASAKKNRRARRSNNNNSINSSYAAAVALDDDAVDMEDMHEERLDDDTEDDDNSIIHRLRLLSKQYDAERMNAQESAAETESVNTQLDVPEDDDDVDVDDDDEEDEDEDDEYAMMEEDRKDADWAPTTSRR